MPATETTEDYNSNPREQQFDSKVLAWVFLFLSVVMVLFAGYSVFAIALPLTRPSAFFDKVTDQYSVENEQDSDQLTVDLAIMLEYVNADIRTAGAQVAIALISGLLLVTIGVLLLTAGITGHLNLQGEFQGTQLKMVTAAPGFAAILLGGAIIIVGVNKDVSRPIDAYLSRPTSVNYEAETVPVNTDVRVEGRASDATRKH